METDFVVSCILRFYNCFCVPHGRLDIADLCLGSYRSERVYVACYGMIQVFVDAFGTGRHWNVQLPLPPDKHKQNPNMLGSMEYANRFDCLSILQLTDLNPKHGKCTY
jgi:hypothetical protein